MTTPTDICKTATGQPAAVFLGFNGRLAVMRKRSDFLAASRSKYQTAPGLTVQMRDRADGDPTVRVGFTCSKKVGNAVARNRAKRRLREVARLDLPLLARPGHDYVLIGKRDVTADRPFADLRADFKTVLAKLANR